MHTIDKRLRFSPHDSILAILEVEQELIGANTWLGLRRDHLEREPDFDPFSGDDHVLRRMAREVAYVVDQLEAGPVRRFFNIEKKQRRYRCPSCEYECVNWEIDVELAQLRPNAPDSTNVFCILCGQNHPVAG